MQPKVFWRTLLKTMKEIICRSEPVPADCFLNHPQTGPKDALAGSNLLKEHGNK
jgi:hypothetical protein